jgi:hypothetical protein
MAGPKFRSTPVAEQIPFDGTSAGIEANTVAEALTVVNQTAGFNIDTLLAGDEFEPLADEHGNFLTE